MTTTGQTTTMTRWQPWTYRDNSWLGADLAGYQVDAIDGEIGKVKKATYDVGSSFLVLETGPLVFGRRVMLPAGVVSGIDHVNKRVFVERSKDQIKNAPEFDEAFFGDMKVRDSLDRYYGEDGAGWHVPASQ